MPDFNAVRLWLSGAKSKNSPPIIRCVLFGSILKSKSPNDVDLLIVSTEWQIRGLCSKLRSEFRAEFGLPLHIQPFHLSQSHDIHAFIVDAGTISEVL